VKDILTNNGYPKHIVDEQINNRCNTIAFNRESSTKDNTINKSYTLLVPFVGKTSFDLKRILKNFIDVRFTVPKKLNRLIKKGERPIKEFSINRGGI